MPTLSEAISAIKAGDKAGGKQMLAHILKAEPQNEQAWLWLAQVAANDDQRRYCLEQVLKIKPGHDLARRGLTILQQQQERRAPLRKLAKKRPGDGLSGPVETGSTTPPPTPLPPGSSDLLNAEFLIEFKSDSTLTPMNEQEKTKYLHIEASRTRDDDNKWQVVSLEEIPPGKINEAGLSCTACPPTSQPADLSGCLPYWQATLMHLEHNDMTKILPLMQTCRWVPVD